MTFQEWLKEKTACEDARKWAAGKTFEDVYATCDRGDWLCWLFFRTNQADKRPLTLVKGLQANQVRHLMKPVSIAAVDAAIAFGRGEITEQDLYAYAAAAADAAYAAAADAAYAAAAAYADAAAACAAAAAYAAAAAAAYAAAATAYAAAYTSARAAILARSAEIFRENIPLEIINQPWDETK